MAGDDDGADVDEVVVRLRARVAERRASGEFPGDFEDALRRQFERIASHRPEPYDVERLRTALQRVESAARFDAALIPTDSGMPGGAALHRLVATAVSRQTSGVLQQVAGFADAVRALLTEVVGAVAAPDGHAHPGLVGQLDAALERLSLLERRPEALVDAQAIRRLVGDRAPVVEVTHGTGIVGDTGAPPTRVDPAEEDAVARFAAMAPASVGAVLVDADTVPAGGMPALVAALAIALQPGGMVVTVAAEARTEDGLSAGSIAGLLADAGFADVWARRLVFSPFEHVVVAIR